MAYLLTFHLWLWRKFKFLEPKGSKSSLKYQTFQHYSLKYLPVAIFSVCWGAQARGLFQLLNRRSLWLFFLIVLPSSLFLSFHQILMHRHHTFSVDYKPYFSNFLASMDYSRRSRESRGDTLSLKGIREHSHIFLIAI